MRERGTERRGGEGRQKAAFSEEQRGGKGR